MTVFETTLDNRHRELSAAFAVNRELGRAWVDVQVDSPNLVGDEPPTPEVTPKMVQGLYYDSARKQVLYRAATGTVVCAQDATVLWTSYLRTTGQCLLTPISEQRKMDDGFNIREQTVAKVIFEAQP